MREVAILAPLVIMVLWLGIYPSAFLGPMHASVATNIDRYQAVVAGQTAAAKLAALPAVAR